MAASYPSSIVALSTKNDGDTIFSSHVDALQDEVIALETALLNGFQHNLIPLNDNAVDLGNSTHAWKNLWTKGTTQFNGIAYTWPAADGTIGQVLGTNGAKVLSWTSPATTNAVADGRLTFVAGSPVTIVDVTGATTVYWSPYKGKYTALYDGVAAWNTLAFVETSLALGTLVNAQAYDVFAYNNSGTLALELLEWANATITVTIAAPGVVTWTAHGMVTGNSITFTTNGALPTGLVANTQYWITVVDANTFKLSTSPANVVAATFITTTGTQSGVHTGHQPQARATALVVQDGVLVKSGATTRRYLGTLLATSTTTGEDSLAKRYLWNHYNRRKRPLQRYETTSTWPYTFATVRQANGAAANQVELVIGVAEAELDLLLNVSAEGGARISAGIGEDSTATYTVGQSTFVNSSGASLNPRLVKYPAVGRHYYSWNEWSQAISVTTWNGQAASMGSTITSGLVGWVEG